MSLIRFIHYLRQHDFSITPSETIGAFQALEVLDLADETEVRCGLRAVLCSTKSEYEWFDTLFSAFFQTLPKQIRLGMSENGQRTLQGERSNAVDAEHTTRIKNETASEAEGVHSSSVISRHSSGNTDITKERTFLQAVLQSRAEAEHMVSANVSEVHFARMLAAAQQFVRRIRMKPGRRWQPVSNGHRINLRRTMRRSLNTGGYPVDPGMLGRRKETARFVLLCDGSRSMASYATTFLQFAYALTCQARHTELFVFSTRVRRVTGALRTVRPPQMPSFTELGAEWGGGTRIGEAVERIIRDEGFRFSTVSTVFIIFSDGLDSGDPDELGHVMRMLSQRVHRVIWINPLASTPGYEPLARGMRAALPFIDLFSSAHDAMSFYQLAQHVNVCSNAYHLTTFNDLYKEGDGSH